MGSYLADQASDEENRIREALKGVGLFFELNFDEDELRRAQELFGRLVVQASGSGTETTLISRYPALTLTTMVGHAGLSYEQGRYWDSFWDELGLDRNQEFEAELRHALFKLLRKFKLREFPDFPGRTYVMAMALHAGIPVHCLSDLVDVIEEHVQHGRDATGAALLEWLTEPGMDYRLGRLDVPVRNFLALGGETAVNVLDRIIEFLVFTLEHPEVWNDLELETATTGLPTLVLNGLIERLRDRPFLADADESATRRALRTKSGPSIAYSLDADEVCVGVPYPESGGDSPWKVTTGGTTREIFAERGWGVDDGEHPLTPVSITEPAREVTMRHEASDATYRVSVFDSADPLLLFSPDGRLIPSQSALPRGMVFALHPKDATVFNAVTREEISAAGDAAVPSGWSGWRFYPLDLAGHASIVLQRAGKDGVIRGVRSLGSPSFDLGAPIPGVHTPSGLSVYAHRPAVDLPPYVGDEPVVWRVRTRRVGDRQWLTDCEWDSDTEVTSLDPFDGVEDALLGHYEVVVRGELGADQRLALVLAEGLKVDYETPFRRPVIGGLTPSICVIASDFGVPIDAEVLEFGASDREKDIRVGSAGHAYKLVVRPPHFEFRIDESGTPAQWRSSSLVSSPADFERHGVIAVRVPNVRSVTFALLDHLGEVLQSEFQERRSNNVFQVASRRFVDTVRRASISRLIASVESQDGSRDEITLADIRPARLCSATTLDGHDLVFEGLADTEDLGVWVWSATAPWTPVKRLAIDNNRATLPDDLHDAGDLISEVFADDPFAVISRPLGPSGDAIRVHQSGWKRHADPVLDGLAQFLAGVGKPPLVAAAADGAWAALALLPWDKTDSTSERLRGGLVQIVLKHPRSALEALGNSVVPQNDMMALLIRTHLVDRPYSASFTLNDLHQNPFVGCMVEIADLPALRAQGANAATERAETLAYLKTQGGEDLIALLRSGKMVNPQEGVFSRSDLAYDALSDEQVAEIFEYARLVPGPLLNPDTRTNAAIEVFNRRREWTADPIARELASHVSRALAAVKKASPALYDAIRARDERLDGVDTAEHPWMLLSVQSLTLAAIARLDSRGEFEYPPMTSDMRHAWSVLASNFPTMVAGDLLVAEALAAHATHGDLIGDGA
ncbi:hypothetical protein [Gordonia sp. SCSIO 19800]|uniref:hypothetical protein n=1 Tax=Gordonia sp. SCSIO 19800 TaxID=2826926 RepID=UPI001B836FA5|nr:hypothetical protein [Gordonia sp. SCSIO 19800]MBR7193514.1 hypothetical protein [Gordonia sp. SCSIO 19800]